MAEELESPGDPETPTPSLQRRVILLVVALLAVLLVVLGVTIDVSLGLQARRNLHDLLLAATSRADALASVGTSPELIAAEINGGSVRALLVTADGATYGDPNISPDTTQTTQVTRQLRQLMIGAGLVTLVVAALLLVLVSRAALAPLDRLAALAKDITTGDRGRRLRPSRGDTELGRAASAFDGMLDALEDSELRAQQAATAAQRAENATRQFLVDAAHELRTPIAGMQVAAEQLASSAGQQQEDPAARGQYRRASLLLSDARRAGRLVADMLDLSRIDAGLPLDRHDTDLAEIVDAESQRTTMLAPQITVTRSGLGTLTVAADPTRVAQILSNLLDNARRYTPAGGAIAIDLRAGQGVATVTVTDTGPGIPDDERNRIFERLVRLDAARTRDHGGAGLGLPIARALARAHGGELVCLPHQGGARFRLTLPLAVAGGVE